MLNRNLTEFAYYPYSGTDSDLNSDGEHTGEYHREYGAAVTYKGNISTPSGFKSQTFYGDDIRYSHVLVMDKPNVDINEYGIIIWKNETYEVRSVKKSLNSVSIALQRVTGDYVPTPETEGITGETGTTGETGESELQPEGEGE